MAVPFCHICQANAEEHRLYGNSGLDEGDYCPICHRPTCKFHLATVRFRWIADRRIDTAKICIECKKTYQHRSWDVARREWIS
jgi:hypothetical protein